MRRDVTFDVLAAAECRELMASRSVGRVAVVRHVLPEPMPAIFPVNYVLSNGAVLFRTAPSTVLADAAARRATVAFEVDDLDFIASTGWSVVVTGPMTELTAGDELDAASFLLPTPWAPGPRNRVMHIETVQVTGRRIRART